MPTKIERILKNNFQWIAFLKIDCTNFSKKNTVLFYKGTCMDMINDFFCVCPSGFSGKICETELHSCNVNNCTACAITPCNHGKCNCTCTAKEEYYNCTCDDGYTGVNCSEDINECMNDSKICGDNGTCVNTNGSFRCSVSLKSKNYLRNAETLRFA